MGAIAMSNETNFNKKCSTVQRHYEIFQVEFTARCDGVWLLVADTACS